MTKKCLEDRATSPCFGFRQNIPLLLQGEGPEGELCCPHPVMLSAASMFPFCHAERSVAKCSIHTGFLALAQNDTKESVRYKQNICAFSTLGTVTLRSELFIFALLRCTLNFCLIDYASAA
jgi:hypothetical protein